MSLALADSSPLDYQSEVLSLYFLPCKIDIMTHASLCHQEIPGLKKRIRFHLGQLLVFQGPWESSPSHQLFAAAAWSSSGSEGLSLVTLRMGSANNSLSHPGKGKGLPQALGGGGLSDRLHGALRVPGRASSGSPGWLAFRVAIGKTILKSPRQQ